jgi:hypothetical protein
MQDRSGQVEYRPLRASKARRKNIRGLFEDGPGRHAERPVAATDRKEVTESVRDGRTAEAREQ